MKLSSALRKTSLISFLFLFLLQGSVLPVSAQAENEAESANQPVYEVQSYAQDIRQLTTQYRGQLQEYRQAQEQYRVAKQQYFQLETLNSLEKALRTTQDALWLRNLVLTTYLRLLRFTLLSQPGIELSYKTATEQRLSETIEDLNQFQTNFAESLAKPELNEYALYFTEELGPQVEEVAYQALINLKIGRLQTVYDKSLVLQQEMETELATISGTLEAAARQRSFAENERLLKRVQTDFDQVEAQFAEAEFGDYKSTYRQLKTPLSQLYANLRRALTYLLELLEGNW